MHFYLNYYCKQENCTCVFFSLYFYSSILCIINNIHIGWWHLWNIYLLYSLSKNSFYHVIDYFLSTVKWDTKEGGEVVVAGWWRRCSSINAMAAHANELEIAKKNLTDAIGDNVKQWVKCVCIYFLFITFILNRVSWFVVVIRSHLSIS